jgi:ABC-type transport system involved in cytochrome c biogenesis ATPase subunit
MGDGEINTEPHNLVMQIVDPLFIGYQNFGVLDVAGLTKRHGPFVAIQAASFSIRPTEILGIIGPNGAGKTTLLEAIAGVLPRDGGEIRWGSTRPRRPRDLIFYLPDGVRPYGDQFVEPVMAFFAGVYRRSAGELSKIASAVGLNPVRTQRVRTLSKGFARRLIWAIGLLAPHPILLMDAGRALWIMLLLLCPLVGFSFFQATSLYAEASRSALQSPVLATSLSPFDGILIPTLGSFYVGVTLLFPFVAIRALGSEKETGALRLLVQLPYGSGSLVAAKLVAIASAWLLCTVPALSALLIWSLLGGHLGTAETLNLLAGQLLYALLIGAIALFAAAIADSSATAAIIALAFTIGSWVLDFALAGNPGLLGWISRLSLTQTLRTFEQGLLSIGLIAGILAVISGFAALAAVWLPPGSTVRTKLLRSIICAVAAGLVVAAASLIRLSTDMTEDQRNSFPSADARALAGLAEPLIVTVHLSPEDPRYVDLNHNVLAKLERVMPNVTIRLAGDRPARTAAPDETYGEVEYLYGGRTDVSRSTSPREVLPLLYALAGWELPRPQPGLEYPGYPLDVDAQPALAWFFGALPALIAGAWWWSRRPPGIK